MTYKDTSAAEETRIKMWAAGTGGFILGLLFAPALYLGGEVLKWLFAIMCVFLVNSPTPWYYIG